MLAYKETSSFQRAASNLVVKIINCYAVAYLNPIRKCSVMFGSYYMKCMSPYETNTW